MRKILQPTIQLIIMIALMVLIAFGPPMIRVAMANDEIGSLQAERSELNRLIKKNEAILSGHPEKIIDAEIKLMSLKEKRHKLEKDKPGLLERIRGSESADEYKKKESILTEQFEELDESIEKLKVELENASMSMPNLIQDKQKVNKQLEALQGKTSTLVFIAFFALILFFAIGAWQYKKRKDNIESIPQTKNVQEKEEVIVEVKEIESPLDWYLNRFGRAEFEEVEDNAIRQCAHMLDSLKSYDGRPDFSSPFIGLWKIVEDLGKKKLNLKLKKYVESEDDPYLSEAKWKATKWDETKNAREIRDDIESFFESERLHHPITVLINCLIFAKKDQKPLPGVFVGVKREFSNMQAVNLLEVLKEMRSFRNLKAAHSNEHEGFDQVDRAIQQFKVWVEGMKLLKDY